MDLLLNVVAAISAIFGIGLLFSPARGSFIAAVIAIGAAVVAYDQKSFIPIFVGFALLWLMRLLGIEKRK